jgi:hypothetical protein
LALLAHTDRELRAAIVKFGAAIALCGSGRHRRERAYTLLHMGQTMTRLGDRDAARTNLFSAAAEFRGIGDQQGTVFALLAMSVGARCSQDMAGAGRLAAEALNEPVMSLLEAARAHAAWMAAEGSKGVS